MPKVERVTESFALGEGPHWDSASQSLYFVDIFGKKIARYIPSTKKITKASLDKQVSFIIPIESRDNEFIVAQESDLIIISWDGESDKVKLVQKICTVDPEKKFNDGKCDSSGRLWAGAHIINDFKTAQPLGTLYSLDAKKQLKGHVDKILCSNGLAFNDATKKMYYIDTLTKRVDRFDIDVTNGTVSNRVPWFTFEKFNVPGFPDGMTIDANGNLWVAVFDGSRVLKIDGSKSETLLDTIDIPTEQVTSVAFGGPNLDELYVTTGSIDLKDFGERKTNPPVSGAIYKVTGTGAKGLPAIKFKFND